MMKALVILLVVLVAVVAVPGGGGGGGPGDVCSNVTNEYGGLMSKLMESMKHFHQECIMYTDDEMAIKNMVKRLASSFTKLIPKAVKKMCNKEKRKRPKESPCSNFVELDVEDVQDNLGNMIESNFTRNTNKTKAPCDPQKTWFKPHIIGNQTVMDPQDLLRRHPDISDCHNATSPLNITLVKQHKRFNRKTSIEKLVYDVQFAEECDDHMHRKIVIMRKRCKGNDPNKVVYQVNGFKGVCEEKKGCSLPEFKKKYDMSENMP